MQNAAINVIVAPHATPIAKVSTQADLGIRSGKRTNDIKKAHARADTKEMKSHAK
jgi:hypothetical protein